MRLGSAAKLALWLGPWAGSRTPRSVARTAVVLDGERSVRAYVYRPRRTPRGVYLVTPGLHFAGPDDPRLDRFCRVLAYAGFVVVAPFLPDFLALRVAASTTADLAVAFAHAARIADDERLPGPAVFSISFGSRPAIELCASELGARASALIMFGGFCDFDATIRFAITGEATHEGQALALPYDPLNAPVVHLNLLGAGPPPPEHAGLDTEALAQALRRMVETTWGKVELKDGEARLPHARVIAEALGPKERELFLVGCGLAPGGLAMFEAALDRARDSFAWVDPRPHLARMRPPVVIIHGKDDDVIPWTEANKLAAALPAAHDCEVILTGLYAHTGAALPGPGTVVAEVRALVRLVTLLADAPNVRDQRSV